LFILFVSQGVAGELRRGLACLRELVKFA